ncbi:MAG: AAA family ATPase [Ktedonobacteraceae bacterium]|nr:AAA family ATPase [Ktedonobacteraceae bacterium]
MRCPNCQTMNPANAKFCLECGNRLVICPACGTINLPVAKFCIECGTALQSKEAASGPTSPTQPVSQIATGQQHTLSPAVADNGAANGTTTQPVHVPELLVPSEERRIVTVMFADITGSTPLADRLDPEDLRAILTGYFNLMAEQIRKHGGTVEKYIGDAVMAVFGLPIAHEDDPDRAIRTALDMQAALNQFNDSRQAQMSDATRLQMRIGINTGEVAAPSATYQRQDFLITGDAVNTAARLQQAAAPDTILVGERTYLSARDVFEFRALAPLYVKGKPEPLPTYVVLGPRQRTATIAQHPRGIEGRQAPLVGRTLELMLLHANYARVQAERRPHLITLLGAPGIGKSRLVREFIIREQEAAKRVSAPESSASPKLLYGRCPPYGEGITYWPLVEILRSLLDVCEDESNQDLDRRLLEFVRSTLAYAKRAESAEDIASNIKRHIGRGLNDRFDRIDTYPEFKPTAKLSSHGTGNKQRGPKVALLRAWRVLLEALAEQQPLIIVVEDLQWADEALLEFLEYLIDRITNAPILFLCPARQDFFERRHDWGGGKRNFTTIEMEALSQEECSELVDALLNTDDLPEVLRNTILARAEGNPFFVEEIVRMFIDQGILVPEEDATLQTTRWRPGPYSELLSDLAVPAEHLQDNLLDAHYLLPLPRVPDTIQGVLAARVDLLNPTEKLILQHAAIIGRTFWLSAVLELATGISAATVLDALASLVHRDFILEVEQPSRSLMEHDRNFSFKHILIREVVYNNIPRVRRTQEHAHLALWLEEKIADRRENFIELLAHHYRQALNTWSPALPLHAIEIKYTSLSTATSTGEETPVQLTRAELRQRAIAYLILAGDQALHSYSTLRAIGAYSDALDLLAESGAGSQEHIKMFMKLGDAYVQRGNMEAALREYRQALHLAQQERSLLTDRELLTLYERMAAPATRWLAHFDNTPDPQEIRAYIDAGLQLLEKDEVSSERVSFLTYQALWYIRQMESTTPAERAKLIEQAISNSQQALRLAEQLDDPSTLSLALDAASFTASAHHHYNEAHTFQHRRQRLVDRLIDREEIYDLYISLGRVHEQIADYATALTWFGRAWKIAQTMESPNMLLSSMTGRMRAWRSWNRWENATQVAHDMLHLIEQYQQDEKRQRWALETLATIAYRTGRQEEGEYYTRQYQRLLNQQGKSAPTDEAAKQQEARMHAIYLAREDWQRATATYKEKVRSSEPFPSPEVLSTLAELLVITGDTTEAQAAMCERAIQQAQAAGAHKSLAVALRARGHMYIGQQQWQQAENDLRQALQYCEDLDLPWERGNTLYYLGILYQRRASQYAPAERNKRSEDIGRAHRHFELALGFFESLQAVPAIQRVRRAMAEDTEERVVDLQRS